LQGFERKGDEISASSISASGSRRCRAPGLVARGEGTNVSIAAGAMDSWHFSRRSARYRRAHHGSKASEQLGQQFVIENRPGGAGNIAAGAVVRALPDGYSLLFVTSANAINATLYDNLSFNFIRDIAPVASIVRGPLIMLVNPSFPAKTVPEFIAYAKANPGKISMASNGNGTVSHVAGELFKMMAGVDMVHVPYRSGPPALTDLIGGQVQVWFANLPETIKFVQARKLRGLAVTAATRWEGSPEVPTVDSFVPGYEANATFGVGLPKGTPTEIIIRLNK
jgi:tripartite-type tricarboxylate transporter receptor subunit TctC